MDKNLLPVLMQVLAECLNFLEKPEKYFEMPTDFREGNWKRRKINSSSLEHICVRYPYLPKNALIEINERCAGSNSNECHRHNQAHALILILGTEYGFPEPIGCGFQYKEKGVLPAKSGVILDIYPGCLHDFIASEKHSMFFLSIQTNWITDNDFELVT